MKMIRAESRKLLKEQVTSARVLARLLGKMNATACVVPPAPLFYRHLQMALSSALEENAQNYDSRVNLPTACREELNWWDSQMCKWNGKSILKTETDLTIDSDASLRGWGARCHLQSTGGPWSEEEKRMHINCLELLAATLAVKSFAKHRSRVSILLRIDNTTAVAYINDKSPGGYNLKRFSQVDKESMDVVPGEEYPHHSSIPPRVTEHNSRCRIPNVDGQDGLETESSHLSQDRSTLGPTGSGPICFSDIYPVPTLLQLAARSICRSNRCIPPDVDSHEGVCQPTLESCGQDIISDSDTTGGCCTHSSSLEITAVVSNPAIDADRLPPVNNNRQSRNVQSGPICDAPTASRMAYLRERYRGQRLSEEATDLMLKSWRTKTNKSYDPLFTKWERWCSEQSSDPISGPVTEVANFLAYLFKEGYQYT